MKDRTTKNFKKTKKELKADMKKRLLEKKEEEKYGDPVLLEWVKDNKDNPVVENLYTQYKDVKKMAHYNDVMGAISSIVTVLMILLGWITGTYGWYYLLPLIISAYSFSSAKSEDLMAQMIMRDILNSVVNDKMSKQIVAHQAAIKELKSKERKKNETKI